MKSERKTAFREEKLSFFMHNSIPLGQTVSEKTNITDFGIFGYQYQFALKEEGREGSLAAKKKETTTEAAARLAQPVLEELGLTLWDLRFEKEGSLWYLRYFIDKEEGLTIQDCEAFSRAVDKLLDEADPIPQSYTLEVSSPGIERELTRDWHFEACMGMEITVRFFRPVNGVREFTGTLSGWEDGKVTMLLSGETEMTFALEEASSIRLYNDYTTEDLDIEDDEGE